MENLKEISAENLLANLSHFSGKKICAMVKANAYGHGLEQIVPLLADKVEMFGVANVFEGAMVRELTKKAILVVGKVHDFSLCKKFNLDFLIDNEVDVAMAVKYDLQNSCHLKINCGMNRFGVKSALEMKSLDEKITEEKIKLRSVCAHFPNTQNRHQTIKNYQEFLEITSNLSQNPPISFGGSGIFEYDFPFDILRLGIGLYGYGNKELRPVMKIFSHVCKTFYVEKGEFVGYGQKYRATKKNKIAIVPVGYADGLVRALGGKFCVEIGGKKYRAVGNVCMDAFFVKVDECVNEGECVTIMCDAKIFAQKLGTIPYEILTNFNKFRGKTSLV